MKYDGRKDGRTPPIRFMGKTKQASVYPQIDTNLKHNLIEMRATTPAIYRNKGDNYSHQLPWEEHNGAEKWVPRGYIVPNSQMVRGGARWHSAKEALSMGMNAHNPMADDSLNVPKLKHDNVFEPMRRAAVESGVYRPVNHFRRKWGVKDRMKELARVSRRDLMCLQRYKGDFTQPPVMSSEDQWATLSQKAYA